MVLTTFSAAILLFLVMDPFGTIPLFLAALASVEPGRRLLQSKGIFAIERLMGMLLVASAVQMCMVGATQVM